MRKWLNFAAEEKSVHSGSGNLGELFEKTKGGDATCQPILNMEIDPVGSSAASKVQSSDAADICQNRHGGNAESVEGKRLTLKPLQSNKKSL